MTHTQILTWVLVILAIPLLVLFVRPTIKRIRALDERIEDYHESQKAEKRKGPVNPYADMAGLFGANEENKGKNGS